MQGNRRSVARDAVLLAIGALACRAVVLFILPEKAYSHDIWHWLVVARELEAGNNPYATTTFLNWPPLWMAVIYLLQQSASLLNVPLADVIRWFLISVDSLNVALAFAIAIQFADRAAVLRALTIGLVANPVSLLLICQHGNFDTLVVTALLAFALALLRFHRNGDAVDWLAAAFALGMGVLVKTVPIVLAPLLCLRLSRVAVRARLLGALLLLAPVAIGMSVIYVLAPDAVTTNVLRYRSYAAWFGFPGLLDIAGWLTISEAYAAAFPIIVVIALTVSGRFMLRFAGGPQHLILMMATMLAALIAFGPGYGSQYLAWILPFYAISFVSFDPAWRGDLKTAWVVSSAIYLIEYALIPDLGAFLIHPDAPSWLAHMSDVLFDFRARTLLRLPLLAMYIWLIVAAVGRLRAAGREEQLPSAAIPSLDASSSR